MGGGGEESIYDEWGYHSSAYVSVDFLLPTGIYIPLDISRNSTIKEVKNKLWNEATHYPLFSQLVSAESYAFTYITNYGHCEEIVDESRHLSEFDLFHDLPLLKLVKSQGNIEEKRVVQEIHSLAGIKNEKELDVDHECATFRKEMRKEAALVAQERDSLHWKKLLEHHYPPTVIPFLNDQTHQLREAALIKLRYENIEFSTTIRVNPSWHTTDLTREALWEWEQKSKVRLPSNNPDDYVLRGDGKQFVVGDYRIFAYMSLREVCVTSKRGSTQSPVSTPILTLMHVASVRKFLPESSQIAFHPNGNEPPPVPEKRRTVWPVWQLDTAFSVKVIRAGNITLPDKDKSQEKKLSVHIGLYHGMSTLCPTTYTKEPQRESTGSEYVWDESCYFDINVANLPRCAKLCLVLCYKSVTKKKKDRRDVNPRQAMSGATPIAWVNTTAYDFKGFLKSGTYRLNCWSWNMSKDSLDKHYLNPSGAVLSNPDDQESYIVLQFSEFPALIAYPSHAEVLEEAAQQAAAQKMMFPQSAKSHLAQLADIVKKDRFEDIFDNERNLLWDLRLDCRDHYPEALGKVLSSVKWNQYKNVAMVQALLSSWPQLSKDRAMELLDCHFPDEKVRQFAVDCLEKQLRDDELQQYLLQLVQALKFECYLNSDLAKFCLRRAWNNRKIGHFLFWHLKAELQNQQSVVVWHRYSLLLEAYLYGNIPHMKFLFKQHEAISKMKMLNERVKGGPDIASKDQRAKCLAALRETASQVSFAEALSDVECPLDPSVVLSSLVVEKCKVMNSKMKPLWLVFKDDTHYDRTIKVIYKNGDDLRQDMLTLQTIGIMDMLWKAEGLDLRMNAYGCLATGQQSGMIEVVAPANTIANIQKERKGKMGAFRHQTLLEWIETKSKDNKYNYEKAIENFTYSCAGYCVATYVLGVGDRHSDNIMVTEEGQLVHIDFGHILGNFKSKYGIKRERVPFVLAHDFVHVINKGKNNEKEDFDHFRQLCDRAFRILRKQGDLFITLFALMLQSGLPELTSMKDLNYLRETLALHLSEEKALEQFRSKFKKALAEAWSTSINWFFHNAARDNS